MEGHGKLLSSILQHRHRIVSHNNESFLDIYTHASISCTVLQNCQPLHHCYMQKKKDKDFVLASSKFWQTVLRTQMKSRAWPRLCSPRRRTESEELGDDLTKSLAAQSLDIVGLPWLT